eukprot:SAG31_NODE_5607_length_2425_cov_2.619651_3_plen_95_part_00
MSSAQVLRPNEPNVCIDMTPSTHTSLKRSRKGGSDDPIFFGGQKMPFSPSRSTMDGFKPWHLTAESKSGNATTKHDFSDCPHYVVVSIIDQPVF